MVTNLERYASAAKVAGCPRDQFENFVRAGIVLFPQQLVASAKARECDEEDGPDDLGYGGARGGGKSHWSLSQMGADDCQRVPELQCLLLRKIGKSAQESFEDLKRRSLGVLPHSYSSSSGMLSFPNGSRIILGHYKDERDVDKYLGLSYDLIGIEEDTQLTDQKRRMIRTCLRTAKPNWKPRVYATTNPGGVGHARFRKRFIVPWRKGIETNTRFVPATYRDNPALNKGYVNVLNELTGWQLRAWRDGDWDIMAGQFFSNWREDIHVIPQFKTLPRGWRYWCALDYGFTHFTVCYLLAMSDDGVVYVLAEHAERRRLPEWHASQIHRMLSRFGLTVDNLWAFVAGSDVFAQKGDKDGLTIAEQYEALGIELEEANTDRINGAGEILHRLGDIEQGTDPTMFVTDECHRLIECLPTMMHDDHRPEDVKKVNSDPDTGEGGDDPYDGVRYGVMAVAGGPQTYNWDDFNKQF